MKTRSASALACLLALGASAFAAPSPSAEAVSSAFAFNVDVVRQGNNAEIARGITQMTVRRLMGPAQRELSPDVWVYSGYHPEVSAKIDHRCDTLVITFSDGRVTDLKMVNAQAANVVAAKVKFTAPAVQVAKK